MISNENLNILIESLEDYKRRGVVDPWILNTGEVIEPLDALIELRELRAEKRSAALERSIQAAKIINAHLIKTGQRKI